MLEAVFQLQKRVTASIVTGGRRFALMTRSGFRVGGACTSLGRKRPNSKQAHNACEMDPPFSAASASSSPHSSSSKVVGAGVVEAVDTIYLYSDDE